MPFNISPLLPIKKAVFVAALFTVYLFKQFPLKNKIPTII